jgi:V8-like Glu-specific endopeptidase
MLTPLPEFSILPSSASATDNLAGLKEYHRDSHLIAYTEESPPTISWPDWRLGEDPFPAHADISPFEVIGRDERVRVERTDRPPWWWICRLSITYESGALAAGTGFLIGPRAIATAGHNIRRAGHGAAARIACTFGLNGGAAISVDDAIAAQSHPTWRSSFNPKFDVGCVFIKSKIGESLGWFNVTSPNDAALRNLTGVINCAGYDDTEKQPLNSLWYANGALAGFDSAYLHYMLDTSAGQSGSPVFHTTANARRNAIAIHAYFDGRQNRGVRMTPELVSLFRIWAAG